MSRRPTALLARMLVAVTLLAASRPVALRAQNYPLRPTPIIDPLVTPPALIVNGFVVVRHTQHEDSATTIVKNARIGIRVRPMPFAVVKVQADLANAGRLASDSTVAPFELNDAFIDFAPTDTVRWRRFRPSAIFGQFKQPFGMEYLTPDERILTADRSLVADRVVPRRDMGGMAQFDLDKRYMLMVAVANGEGQNARANPDGKELYTARASIVPIPGVALGGKIADQGGDHYWGYDARWLPSRGVLEGEYVHRARRVGDKLTTDVGGGYVMGLVRLAPWLQPVAKWERLLQHAPKAQELTYVTAGAVIANHVENVRAHLMLQHRRDDTAGTSATVLQAQLTVIY